MGLEHIYKNGLAMYKILIGKVPKCLSEIFRKTLQLTIITLVQDHNYTIKKENTNVSMKLSHFKEFMLGMKYLV